MKRARMRRIGIAINTKAGLSIKAERKNMVF
jgi:hypothetical protein